MVKYLKINDPITGEVNPNVIQRIDENGQTWFIPTDPANSDYQAYLAWQENSQSTQGVNQNLTGTGE